MPFTKVDHTSKSLVITSIPQDGGPDKYAAPETNGNPILSHEINMNIPSGTALFAAWYTPVDRINALTDFALINVRIKDANDVYLDLAAVAGKQSYLRIQIHVLFGVPA